MISKQPVLQALLLFLLAVRISEASPTSISEYEPRPYTIHVDSCFVNQNLLKVCQFSSSLDIEQLGWFSGPPVVGVKEVTQHWQSSFD